MIPYQIRSVQLLNLVRDIRNNTLIPNAYFQRNLVWREIHKKELIETILLGYPFPLIFISQGGIDVEKMTSVSCIVDGQQRCDAIMSFINGDFKVRDKLFSDFSEIEKTSFFKYEIPVCELDVINTDTQVLEMFKRINRTSNSLTNIEKIASEYGATYFMLVAKLISGQIDLNQFYSEDDLTIDPNIPEGFKVWASGRNCSNTVKLFTNELIFSKREISRKVNLQYALNLMSTFLDGFYNRNDKIEDNLNLYVDEFLDKDRLLINFEKTSEFYNSLNLNNDSPWLNKANFFTLFIFLSNLFSKNIELNLSSFKNRLDSITLDESYKLAAKEGVNNLKERIFRNSYLVERFPEYFSLN